MRPTSLDSWTKEAESLETAKNLLYFKQLVGLKFDKRRLAALEGRSKTHYTRYLRDHGGDAHAPRGLFLMSVSAVGNAETFKQFLADHLEILYDIDIGARDQAKKAGIEFARIESLNTSPLFIKALAAVVQDSLAKAD